MNNSSSSSSSRLTTRRQSHIQVALPQIITYATSPEQETNKRKRSCVTNCLRRIWSIPTLIIILLVLAVGITAGSVWPTNYAFAKRGVSDVARIARLNLINRMTTNIEEFLSTGPRFLNVTVDAFRIYEKEGGNILLPNKSTSLRLLSLAFHSPYVTSVDFGYISDGSMIGLQLAKLQSYETNGNGTLLFHEIDPVTFEMGKLQNAFEGYYIRDRPWYTVPLSANRTKWSEPFASVEDPPKYIITIGKPYVSFETQELIGVVALECDLNLMSSFLRTLPDNNSTRIIIVDTNATLIGTSSLQSYDVVDDQLLLSNAENSPDPIIRETVTQLQKRNMISAQAIETGVQEFSYGHNRRKRIVTVHPITDKFGIEWFAVTNVADNEIMHSVYDANTISACVCAACLVVAVIVAIILGICVAAPLRRVRREMDKVANMNFEKQKKIRSFYLFELNEIIVSLERMKYGLRNFEKYVPSPVVKAIVRSQKQNSLGVVPRELTVLFCDIKDFTTLSEIIDPNSLVQLLSGFFTTMSDIIAQQQGAVDKYVCIL
jgi:hypothetical protein